MTTILNQIPGSRTNVQPPDHYMIDVTNYTQGRQCIRGAPVEKCLYCGSDTIPDHGECLGCGASR